VSLVRITERKNYDCELIIRQWREERKKLNETLDSLRHVRALLRRIEESIKLLQKTHANEKKVSTERHWARYGRIAVQRRIASELREILKLPAKSS